MGTRCVVETNALLADRSQGFVNWIGGRAFRFHLKDLHLPYNQNDR